MDKKVERTQNIEPNAVIIPPLDRPRRKPQRAT